MSERGFHHEVYRGMINTADLFCRHVNRFISSAVLGSANPPGISGEIIIQDSDSDTGDGRLIIPLHECTESEEEDFWRDIEEKDAMERKSHAYIETVTFTEFQRLWLYDELPLPLYSREVGDSILREMADCEVNGYNSFDEFLYEKRRLLTYCLPHVIEQKYYEMPRWSPVEDTGDDDYPSPYSYNNPNRPNLSLILPSLLPGYVAENYTGTIRRPLDKSSPNDMYVSPPSTPPSSPYDTQILMKRSLFRDKTSIKNK